MCFMKSFVPPWWKCRAGYVVPSFNMKMRYDQPKLGFDLLKLFKSSMLKFMTYFGFVTGWRGSGGDIGSIWTGKITNYNSVETLAKTVSFTRVNWSWRNWRSVTIFQINHKISLQVPNWCVKNCSIYSQKNCEKSKYSYRHKFARKPYEPIVLFRKFW